MKILIFSLAYPPFIGGAELAVKEITDRLTDIEFEMVTANLDGKQPVSEKVGNIQVYRLGKGKLSKYFFPWLAFKKAKELYPQKKYDAVWSIMANQAGIAALMFKKKFPRVKYLLTLQEGDSLKRIWSRTWFMRKTYKEIYTKADSIQAISSYLAKRAKKYGYQGEVKIIPNGVDLEKFKKDFNQEELFNLRKELGLNPTDKVLVTASRLVFKNGVDTLIKAIKNLQIKVLILGQGNLETKLKALAQELGVKDRVLFLGHISQKDLPKYLRISDIFVRTSRSEGLGSAFLEAMAANLPVIGTEVGGIPDFLCHQENGLFCEVDNPSDLATKIKMLLEDNNLRQKIINNAKQLVNQNYDWAQISSSMDKIFSQLCQNQE